MMGAMARRPLKPEQIEVLDDAMVEILRGKTMAQRGDMITASHRTAKLMISASVGKSGPRMAP